LPLAAAQRELQEETGLAGADWQCLGTSSHQYPDRLLNFTLFRCTCVSDVELQTETPFAWLKPDALADYPMPEANRELLGLLT